MSNSKSQLLLLAVLRYSDKAVIAHLSLSNEITIEGIRECVAANSNIITGKLYTSQGSMFSIHYKQDTHGRVYAIVTSPSYSARVAYTALEDLSSGFGKHFGPRSASATEGSLSKPCKQFFEDLSSKLVEYPCTFIRKIQLKVITML